MRNLPLTEDAFLRALREMETPSPGADLIDKLREKRRSIQLAWTLPLTAATALTLVLVLLLSTPSRVSLAQVVTTYSQVRHHTITSTHLLGPKGPGLKAVSYVDGKLWKIVKLSWGPGSLSASYGLADRTVSIAIIPPVANFATIDDRREVVESSFDIRTMLRSGAKPQVERNVLWQGRRVDRFTVHTTYRDSGRIQTDDQVLIADPKTKLPVQLKEMRDGASWGDVVDYDFGPIPKDTFVPSIPKGTAVYDLREQRKSLPSQLAASPLAAILIDEVHTVWVLTRARLEWNSQAKLSLLSPTVELAGGTSLVPSLCPLQLGQPPKAAELKIGNSVYHVVRFGVAIREKAKLDPIWRASSIDAKLTAGAHILEAPRVPVIRTGDAVALLRPFAGRS